MRGLGLGLGLQKNKHAPAEGGGGDSYTQHWVVLDRNSISKDELTGATENEHFSWSGWFDYAAEGVASKIIWVIDPYGNYASEAVIKPAPSGQPGPSGQIITWLGGNSDGDSLVAGGTTEDVDYGGSRVHALCSGNSLTGVIKVYINGVDVTNFLEAPEAAAMLFNGYKWVIGSDGQGSDYIGSMADLWIAPGQSLLTAGDIAPATLAKFIDAEGGPVDLGADGSIPTGVAPAVPYFTGNAANWAVIAAAHGWTIAKILTGDGRNGAGAMTLAGASVGQTVLGILSLNTYTDVSGDFESTISVNGQIQQSGSTDYTGDTLKVSVSASLADV